MRLWDSLRDRLSNRITESNADPASRRARLKRAACLLLLGILAFSLTLGMVGCVSQEEIDAAIAAAGEEDLAPLEPGEAPLVEGEEGEATPAETEEDEESEPAGIIEQLANMLGSRSQSLQIVALLTILSLAPSILIMLTSFLRIIMVLSFTRSAMGLQQMPPNQVMIGLALFLTFFIMGPVIDEIKTEAYIPYVAEQIELDEAIERGSVPLKSFMLRQTRENDIALFCGFAGEEIPGTDEELLELPMRTLIPAFLTSELKRAFEIGFFIYIPFIVIDMVVASVLMAMGMMMLPPIVISLPFKVLLFVVVDGWTLTMQTLVGGFL